MKDKRGVLPLWRFHSRNYGPSWYARGCSTKEEAINLILSDCRDVSREFLESMVPLPGRSLSDQHGMVFVPPDHEALNER